MKKSKPVHNPAFPNTRKAQRKEKRQQKKKNRLDYYSKKKEERKPIVFTPGRFVKIPANEKESPPEPKVKKIKNEPSLQDVLIKQVQKEKNDEVRLKAQMEKQRKMILLKANEEEDKVIKKLEKQLGLKKSKNKKNFFADDGLDYLLEACDRMTTEKIVAAEKHLADVDGDSDFEEDLAVVTGKEIDSNKLKTTKNKTIKDHSDEDDMDKSGFEDDMDEDSEGASNEIESEDDISEDDWSMDNDDEEMDEEYNMKDKSNVKNKKLSEEKRDDTGSTNEDSELSGSAKGKVKSEIKKETIHKHVEKHTNDKDIKKKLNKVNTKEKVISGKDLNKTFSDDEVSNWSDDDDDDVVDDNFDDCDDDIRKVSSHNDSNMVKQAEKPDVWEDIYGRKRDKKGNVIKEEKGVYIPPHLRNKESSSDAELLQLNRQIKSVLNKLAGANLHWVCNSIEALYASHSRHAVNGALTRQWLAATVAPAATPDRMAAEHAALVAVLHANVGAEIGAHFLQELCKQFDEMTQVPQPIEDKRLDNLVSCLAHLYSFKIYHAALLYDILARLLDEITEKGIDCVLTALRCVGGVLRREEPAALRSFIHDTQGKVAGLQDAAGSGSRIKFLMEVLMAVKNNNLKKIPNYEPSYVENLRKLCRGVVRKGNTVTPLSIRLEDLLKAEERGKWWVVGSAWEGGGAAPGARPEAAPAPAAASGALLELARKQRMNTDVRRSIFCVIMAAEDYMDAFEKLQHLGLRGTQEREIVHVLLACCSQERVYNPYYAVLAMKLIDTDRKYQLSIQYALWDKIKELESLSKLASANLAQLIIHLILEKGQPLSILKIIQFSDLNKTTVRFMRQILLAIIMNTDLQAALEVFHRISKPPKLHMFRESLRLFIQHFLIKNAGKKTSVLSDDEMATLRERTLEVDRILTMYDTKLRL